MQKTLIQRIKQRIREHGEFYMINELCLDEIDIGIFTPQVNKIIQKCVHVEQATFNGCELKQLSNLPKFEKLECLQLAQNKIKGCELRNLLIYPNLKILNLENNLIEEIADLEVLKNFPQLTKLNIQGNPLCKENYHQEIFSLLPHLELIDFFDLQGQYIEEINDSDVSSEFSDSEQEESSEDNHERESPSKAKKKN